MKLKIYQVDAFTDKLFSGNPAAVCPLEEWLPESLMQKIAMENNLAETAFYVKNGDRYDIRWFTPAVEVDLCGHATLAAAFILFRFGNVSSPQIKFHAYKSGELLVSRDGDLLTLDFPADDFSSIPMTEEFLSCFNERPIEAYRGKTDIMFVFENEQEILNMQPRIEVIASLKARGVIVTAKGERCDFVSRFFAPQSGITEDPVTGSAHTTLTPYWFQKTGKKQMKAVQLSPRRGQLLCTYNNNRILIGGQARLFLEGEILIEDEL